MCDGYASGLDVKKSKDNFTAPDQSRELLVQRQRGSLSRRAPNPLPDKAPRTLARLAEKSPGRSSLLSKCLPTSRPWRKGVRDRKTLSESGIRFVRRVLFPRRAWAGQGSHERRRRRVIDQWPPAIGRRGLRGPRSRGRPVSEAGARRGPGGERARVCLSTRCARGETCIGSEEMDVGQSRRT
jgi:hypothetical protein